MNINVLITLLTVVLLVVASETEHDDYRHTRRGVGAVGRGYKMRRYRQHHLDDAHRRGLGYQVRDHHHGSYDKEPTYKPTYKPTREPTHKPTKYPTYKPTKEPTYKPTKTPTAKPSKHPTYKPTREPTYAPTYKPTREPTYKPTKYPTYKPTKYPTYKPTKEPTYKPTKTPTAKPSKYPTYKPTYKPTFKPTQSPRYTQVGQDKEGRAGDTNIGAVVSSSGDGKRVVVVGRSKAGDRDGNGPVYVYHLDENEDWVSRVFVSEKGDDKPVIPLGVDATMSNDGNHIAIGKRRDDADKKNGKESVTVYTWLPSLVDDYKEAHDPVWVQRGTRIRQSGTVVALSESGERLAIGDPEYNYKLGRVQLHKCVQGKLSYQPCTWRVMGGGEAVGDNAKDEFGFSLHLSPSGGTLAVGAPGTGNGYVRLFSYNDGEDSDYRRDLQEAPTIGLSRYRSDISPDFANDDDASRFGQSVAVLLMGRGESEDVYVAAGAPGFGRGRGSSAVYQADDSGNDFQLLGNINQEGPEPQAQAGTDVALAANPVDGEIILVSGEPGCQEARGCARIYSYLQMASPDGPEVDLISVLEIDEVVGPSAGSNAGYSVSASSTGEMVSVGYPGFDSEEADPRGFARTLRCEDCSSPAPPATAGGS